MGQILCGFLHHIGVDITTENLQANGMSLENKRAATATGIQNGFCRHRHQIDQRPRQTTRQRCGGTLRLLVMLAVRPVGLRDDFTQHMVSGRLNEHQSMGWLVQVRLCLDGICYRQRPSSALYTA